MVLNKSVKKEEKLNTDKLIAFLASMCLFLSAIEYVIPKPLPFMRLGLANMPIIIGILVLKPKHLFLLVLLKVIGQGFITGTFFSYIFLFSFAGSFASACIMLAASKIFKNTIGPIGISLLGSLANAFSQIVLSDIMLYGESTIYIAPIITISSCITGFLLGLFTAHFLKESIWYSTVLLQSDGSYE